MTMTEVISDIRKSIQPGCPCAKAKCPKPCQNVPNFSIITVSACLAHLKPLLFLGGKGWGGVGSI